MQNTTTNLSITKILQSNITLNKSAVLHVGLFLCCMKLIFKGPRIAQNSHNYIHILFYSGIHINLSNHSTGWAHAASINEIDIFSEKEKVHKLSDI